MLNQVRRIAMALRSIVMALAPLHTAQALNVIHNGSFEGDYGWNHVDRMGAARSGRIVSQSRVDGRWVLRVSDPDTSSHDAWQSIAAPVDAGAKYSARVRVLRVAGTSPPDVYVRYYDAKGTLLATAVANIDGPIGTWVTGSLDSSAPPRAQAAKVGVFSSDPDVGIYYFDAVELVRADAGNLVDDAGFDIEAVGAHRALGWTMREGSRGSVTISRDPADAANQALELFDASDLEAVEASTSFEVIGALSYRAGAKVYADSDSEPLELRLEFFDQQGNTIAKESARSRTHLEWDDIHLHLLAPPDAVRGRLVVRCGETERCRGWYDFLSVRESWDETTSVRYIAPAHTGNGSGRRSSDVSKGAQLRSSHCRGSTWLVRARASSSKAAQPTGTRQAAVVTRSMGW